MPIDIPALQNMVDGATVAELHKMQDDCKKILDDMRNGVSSVSLE